ncbi:hypothetical protein BASA81_008338 [Batrachochytrium salamandrivorans]|nr:hypothetical protein BASA81_008338 [Batrachochytrium salamandrivorans]
MLRRGLSSFKHRYEFASKLAKCQTPEDLERAIALQTTMDCVTYTSAMKLVNSKIHSPLALDLLLRSTVQIVTFSPPSLAECIESFSKQSAVPNELLDRVDYKEVFTPSQLTAIAWTLARTGQTSHLAFDKIRQQVATRKSLADFKPIELAKTAWAFSKCSGDDGVLNKIANEVMSRGLGKFTPSQLCGLLATTKHCSLLNKVLIEVETRSGFLKQCSSRNLTELLAVVAANEKRGMTKRFAIELMVRSDLGKLPPADFVSLVQSLAGLMSVSEPGGEYYLFHKLIGEMDLDRFTPEQVASVCHALFELPLLPSSEWIVRASLLVQDLDTLLCFAKWQVCSNQYLDVVCAHPQATRLATLWALACLDVLDDARVQHLFSLVHLTKQEEEGNDLAQMHQVQLAWNQSGSSTQVFGYELPPPSPQQVEDSTRTNLVRLARRIESKVDEAAFAVAGVQVDVLLPARNLAIELVHDYSLFEDGSKDGFVQFQQRLLERAGVRVEHLPRNGLDLLGEREQLRWIQRLLL